MAKIDADWYDTIIAAKARARLNNLGHAFAVQWPDGHCTVEDRKPFLRSRDMRVLDCDCTGAECLASRSNRTNPDAMGGECAAMSKDTFDFPAPVPWDDDHHMEPDPEFEPIQCPTCKGRGTVNPLTTPDWYFCTGTTTCPACEGTGEFE